MRTQFAKCLLIIISIIYNLTLPMEPEKPCCVKSCQLVTNSLSSMSSIPYHDSLKYAGIGAAALLGAFTVHAVYKKSKKSGVNRQIDAIHNQMIYITNMKRELFYGIKMLETEYEFLAEQHGVVLSETLKRTKKSQDLIDTQMDSIKPAIPVTRQLQKQRAMVAQLDSMIDSLSSKRWALLQEIEKS